MFDIDICEARQVVLVRFRGRLTEADFVELDKLAAQQRGKTAFDCSYDMSSVEQFDLATSFVAKRGDLPQPFKDRERIYVVSNDDLRLLVRLYAAYQANKGWKAPVIVASLSEAMNRLGVTLSDFNPVPSVDR